MPPYHPALILTHTHTHEHGRTILWGRCGVTTEDEGQHGEFVSRNHHSSCWGTHTHTHTPVYHSIHMYKRTLINKRAHTLASGQLQHHITLLLHFEMKKRKTCMGAGLSDLEFMSAALDRYSFWCVTVCAYIVGHRQVAATWNSLSLSLYDLLCKRPHSHIQPSCQCRTQERKDMSWEELESSSDLLRNSSVYSSGSLKQ